MTEILVTRDGLVGNSPRYTTSPPYKKILKDDSGAILDLTGCSELSSFTVTLVYHLDPTIIKQGIGTWAIVGDAAAGEISYQYADADLSVPGNWYLFVTVQLPNEPSPRAFDPDFLSIIQFPGGVPVVTISDINLKQVNGTTISTSNAVPVSVADGANVALGATTDTSSANTNIGLLKAIKSYLSGSGSLTETSGTTADAAWSGSGNASEIALLKKIALLLIGTLTISGAVAPQVASANVSTANPLPTTSGQVGTATPYGSNPATTNAGAETLFKWGAGGTTTVQRIAISNETGSDVRYELDQTATANSLRLKDGNVLFIAQPCATLHLFTVGVQNINQASGVMVRGWN